MDAANLVGIIFGMKAEDQAMYDLSLAKWGDSYFECNDINSFQSQRVMTCAVYACPRFDVNLLYIRAVVHAYREAQLEQ